MGKQAVQQQGAVPLLHDGPLLHESRTNGEHSEALLLLQRSLKSGVNLSSASLCLTFLSNLSSAQRIKDQLQILQAFKSFIIQLSRSRTDASVEENQSTQGSTGFRDGDMEELLSVYRILLEWSLGRKTPLPLRKTIHSILETIYDVHQSKAALESIFVSQLAPITSAKKVIWEDPLDSLDALLSLVNTRAKSYLARIEAPCINFLCQKAGAILSGLLESDERCSSKDVETSILDGVKVSMLSKTLLQNQRFSENTNLNDLTDLFWLLLRHRMTPADSLPPIGMAYGKTVAPNDWLDFVTSQLERATTELEPLPRVCFSQGLAAGIPDDTMVLPDSQTDALRLFETFFGDLVRQAVDPEVRLAALKGIRTLMSRSLTLLGSQPRNAIGSAYLSVMDEVSDRVLEVVLQTWENPPTRKMSVSLPSVFQSAVDWKICIGESLDNSVDSQNTLHKLVDRLLEQPPYRKGKYNALECLLPKVGVRRILVKDDENHCSSSLLSDLLEGIGDASHNSGAMADLWAKLLQSLFLDVHKIGDFSKNKKGKKNSKTTDCDAISVSEEWLGAWVPSLSQALVASEWNRRRQIAAFCLPRVSVIVAERTVASLQSFAALLEHIAQFSIGPLSEISSVERETASDRKLWAMMEVTRYSAVEKKLAVGEHNPLKESIVRNMSISRLTSGLRHFSDTVRSTSFQAMEGIVESIKENPMERCVLEVDLWKSSLAYAAKAEGKEYLSSLLYRLLAFLDRLSRCEAREMSSNGTTEASTTLPVFGDFVMKFLLDDLFVQQLTYPGSVVSKETFSLSLLECILVFSCRDTNAAFESKLLPKSGALYERRRTDIEESTLKLVRSKLLSPSVVGSLLSMLHSSWDGTKSKSFDSLATLILLARRQSLPLPVEFFGRDASARLREQGFLLSCSPRQRESETGARILALIGLSKMTFASRVLFLQELSSTLEERLGQLRKDLEYVLKPDADVRLGREVPLIHGIILALRLLLEAEAFEIPDGDPLIVLDELSTTLCNGMQVSLAVVADVQSGENIEGVDVELGISSTKTDDPTKGKVNPGAIGANGIFSSLSRVDSVEYEKRLASQRIIVGSWLLTKEACASIAAVLTAPGYTPRDELCDRAGALLISTLTSLKHTGAAYAAHSALQKITTSILGSTQVNIDLPLRWIDRLFTEITTKEKIRDSTLRRSTGYSLGFLSIMRSEISLRAVPRRICESVTHRILSLTLPSASLLREFLSTVGMSSDDKRRIFSFLKESELEVAPEERSTRTRVHALNVLRFMILDAPLSSEIFPLVGDALVSAIIGYVDSEWAIRNSAGMVFSAAMLRVVDADKNAANTNVTSKNAITLSELFQSYPALCDVLFGVLNACINGTLKVDGEGSLPPILPILVLLYRVQPLDTCGPEVVAQMQKFRPLLSACLGHRHLSVRQAGARAFCNLSVGDNGLSLSVSVSYKHCLEMIHSAVDWNQVHGAILLIKELHLRQRLPDEASDKDLLLRLLDTSGGTLIAPPLCLMDVIHTLETMPHSEQQPLSKKCFQFIRWVSGDAANRLHIPGISELCAAAASAACRCVTLEIFEGRQSRIGDLSFLIECGIVDVRITATKSFKKLIYNGLDELVENSSDSLIQGLGDAVAAALAKELSREGSPIDPNGTHPPTLRRLSRCLLEIYNAHKRVDDSQFFTQPSLRELALDLLERKEFAYDEPTPLIGNAVELLASSHSPENEDAGLVWPLLERLSSSGVPWRLRYSAACASAELWQKNARVPRTLLMRLLQDEDPDARFVLAKALATRNKNDSIPVTEHVLTHFILENEQSLENGEAFLHRIAERAERMWKQLQRLSHAPTSEDALRKIFEDEDPNSYHEPALQEQATLLLLWETIVPMLISEERESLTQLLGLALNAVKFLSDHADKVDSLCRAVFSDLHLVLLTTSGAKDPELALAAQALLNSAVLLHPSLVAALRLHDVAGKSPSRKQIQECCFLLTL